MIVEKKYSVLYNDVKAITLLVFADDISISTSDNIFGTDDYDELVDFIYTNNLYLEDNSKINFDKLKTYKEDVEETLFKYDD